MSVSRYRLRFIRTIRTKVGTPKPHEIIPVKPTDMLYFMCSESQHRTSKLSLIHHPLSTINLQENIEKRVRTKFG